MPTLQVVSASDAVAEIRAAINDHAAQLATAVLGGDARLSDQRVPSNGSVTWAKLGAGLVGTTSSTIAAGDDFRFSNPRAPTPHHATHEPGGGDAIDLTKLHMSGTKAAMLALTASSYPGAYYYATDDWGGSLYQSAGGSWVLRLSKNQQVLNLAGTGGVIDFTVDGNTDVAYELRWALHSASPGGPFWLRFNGDTGANYSPNVGSGTNAMLLGATSGIGTSRQVGVAIIHAAAVASTLRTVDIRSTTYTDAGAGSSTVAVGTWANTADNVTAIGVSNQFNAMTGQIVLRRLAIP